MRWLRTLMIAVFLIGSWQVPAAHAARMAENHHAAAIQTDEPAQPPCHSVHEQPDGAQAPVATAENDDGDCCQAGHCDCAHANPATPVLSAAIELETFATTPPLPKFAMLRTSALDIPLRPPAR
jgi:hypothetical protein